MPWGERMNQRCGPFRAAWMVTGVSGALLACCAGCQPIETRSAPPVDPAVVLNTPADAARSLMHFLVADLRAAARHESTAMAAARDQVVWHIAAREDILQRYQRALGARAKDEIQVLNDCVESWASIIAYYVDGLGLDRLQEEPAVEDAHRAVVRIPARGRGDQAVIRISCLQGSDGKWHVRTLDLAEPTAASMPASTKPAAAQGAGGKR